MVHKKEVAYSVLILLMTIILAVGLVYMGLKTLNPSRFLDKTRDETRLQNLASLKTAIDLYIADGQNFDNLMPGKVYISNTSKTNIDGLGWLPLNFNLVSSGAPLSFLPTDPLNNDDGFVYRVGVNTTLKTYEIDCRFESSFYQNKAKLDQGNSSNWYEIGTDLNILN